MLPVILCIVLVCGYVYLKQTYFTLRPELPGLSPHFLFGNLIQTGILSGRVSLPEALAAFKKRYGDIYQFWLGPSYNIIVNDITDVQHIFCHRNIYDQGDFFIEKASVLFPDGLICTKGYFLPCCCFSSFCSEKNPVMFILGVQVKRHAAVTYPLFRRGKFTPNLDLIIECVDQLLAKWRERPEGQVHTDIFQQFHKLMLAIFGFIAFDYDLQTLDEDHKTGSNELAEALEVINNAFQLVTYAPRWLSILYLKLSSRHQRAKKLVQQYL
ncbi:unnamed protein product [Rotaria socialis]|uniref:Cytochrome P450 n=1 Tax=Rotaria socialis TaxID=392032 RepID=A0A818BSL6_9BILA|nr:unnamed protein product [Rotaria socialis]